MKVINENEFNELIKEGITLVDFFAEWCGPCKMLSPILEELSNEYSNIKFVKVDCDQEMALAERFNIMSIPAIYMFKDGEILSHTGGYQGKDQMKNFIDKALEK